MYAAGACYNSVKRGSGVRQRQMQIPVQKITMMMVCHSGVAMDGAVVANAWATWDPAQLVTLRLSNALGLHRDALIGILSRTPRLRLLEIAHCTLGRSWDLPIANPGGM